ncbi:PKD domain-containing protein [Pseudomonadota bacterium]
MDPGGIASASLDVVGDTFDLLGIEAGGGTAATSFTEFEGGLEAPSAEGYGEGVAEVSSVREYILNVTNFVLGFLGLLAVLIIIYGGFLYLTAAGREEQAGKGKKSIMYAVIGMLVIMGSYAIVNTVLQAPSGTEDGGLAGSAPETVAGTSSGQVADQRAGFYRASIEIRNIAEDFYSGYLHYDENRNAIDSLSSFLPTFTTHQEFRSDAEGEIAILNRIKSIANPLDSINEAVDDVIDVYEEAINNSATIYNEVAAEESSVLGAVLPDAEWKTRMEAQQNFLDPAALASGDLTPANQDDFAKVVVRTSEQLQELRDSISEVTTEGLGVDEAFDDLIGSSGSLTSLATGSTTDAANPPVLNNTAVSNTEILRIVEQLASLSKAVQQIQFVSAIITSDIKEGSAPLIVNFDGLRTLDPLKTQIPSENFHWDFEGDGIEDATGVSVDTIYTEVGTYIPRLRVDSPNEGQVADGIAYSKITVREPAIKINMEVTAGGTIYAMRKYDSVSGNLITDKSILKVTTTEASANGGGVTFNASETDNTQIRTVRWDFGDLQPEIIYEGDQSPELTQNIAIEAEGTYQVVLEITDRLNNVDRKIINIVVGTPAARIQVLPGTIGGLETEFSFDGGESRSDAGQVQTYDWTYPADAEVLSVTDTDEVLKLKFGSTGNQNVTLLVTDSLGSTDDATVTVKVESKPPVAQFFTEMDNPQIPARVWLDASDSYDPDGDEIVTYEWFIDENPISEQYVDIIDPDPQFSIIEFRGQNKYDIGLTVTDSNGDVSEMVTKEVDILDKLDIIWSALDTVTAQLNENGEAEVSVSLISKYGKVYEMDWGDSEVETGDLTPPFTSLSHTYKEAGVFNVNVSVFDEFDNENTNARKIFIGTGDMPLAVIGAEIRGNPIINSTEGVTISRNDIVNFSAGASRNVDGTGRRLTYSWNFGDGTRSTQKETTHTFREVGDYEVYLTVADESGRAVGTSTDLLVIAVEGQPPTLRGLAAVPSTADLTTPVQVNLNAIGAEDPDGHITKYRWHYYDVAVPEETLGTQVTTLPNATMTIGTKGREDDEVTYAFVVEITDDENATTSSLDRLAVSPTLTVVNGPNKPPTASFNVDRTSVMVGESINFTSSSSDPDGQIIDYIWDFEGDGFADNFQSLSANESHTFLSPAREGLAIRLKVIDDKGSVAYSDPVTVYIDSSLLPPTAAFTSEQLEDSTRIQFTDNSSVDASASDFLSISKWSWDFDVSIDSNGDSINDNDTESTEQNPTHDYVAFGIKRAKLTVEDTEGNSASVTNFVNISAPKPAAPEPPTTPSEPLDARLITNPSPNVIDSKIHLQGSGGNVTFNYGSSVGDIATYIMDKNVYFDTNGNGIKNDDEDHMSTTGGSWTTDFDSSWGNIRVRLTVKDSANMSDFVEKDIVFDTSADSTLVASTLSLNEKHIPALLVTLVGFAILALSILKFKKEK